MDLPGLEVSDRWIGAEVEGSNAVDFIIKIYSGVSKKNLKSDRPKCPLPEQEVLSHNKGVPVVIFEGNTCPSHHTFQRIVGYVYR